MTEPEQSPRLGRLIQHDKPTRRPLGSFDVDLDTLHPAVADAVRAWEARRDEHHARYMARPEHLRWGPEFDEPHPLRPDRLPDTGILAPDGRRFPWGPIVAVHRIGRFAIVEYLKDCSNSSAGQPAIYLEHGQTSYGAYIDDHSTHTSYRTLESALVGVIAYDREGPNGRAAHYFDLMTGAAT